MKKKNVKEKKVRLMRYQDFYASDDYKNLKEILYNTNEKICLKCDSKEDIQIDHIKPKSKHPEKAFDIFNLQMLCKKCNFEKGSREVSDYRTKAFIKNIRVYLKENKTRYNKIKYRNKIDGLVYEYPSWYKEQLDKHNKKRKKQCKAPSIVIKKEQQPLAGTVKTDRMKGFKDPKLNVSKILQLQRKLKPITESQMSNLHNELN